MKRFFRMMFVASVAVASLASSCHPEPPQPDPPPPPPDPDPQVVIIDTIDDIPSQGAQFSFKIVSSEAWTATVPSDVDWCTIDQTSGEAGEYQLVLTVAPNDSYQSRKCEIYIKRGTSDGTIVITQLPQDQLEVTPSELEVECEGGTFTVEVTANVEYEVAVSAEWLSWEDCEITVEENPEYEPRSATITLAGGSASAIITITQKETVFPEDDVDGVVTAMQAHEAGKGIPLVFMGDAFSREQIEDGSYAAIMERAAEAFFAVEPFTSFRELFDVYSVNVVSAPYEDYNTPGETTLGTYFGTGTNVGGDIDMCRKYARRAIDRAELDNALVVILLNREFHAGRCYLSFVTPGISDQPEEETRGDCARGVAYAFVALGLDEDDFTYLVQHEAGGHGFGKLADEYVYDYMGVIPQATIDEYRSVQTLHHAYMNIDFTSEAEDVLWHAFLTDERYVGEDVGIWEGAGLFPLGAYRPSETSIMGESSNCFNAPSREAIYYRLHKIAYGRDWEYDFEEFAAYDAINRAQQPDACPVSFSLCPPPISYRVSTALQ